MKKQYLFITILFTLFVYGCRTTHLTNKDISDEMDLFLLIGQSNMAGRGVLDSTQLNLSGIYVLNKDNEWVEAMEPIHYDKPVAGAGLAASFAIDIKKQTERKIGLIPCAIGGTSINLWQPNVIDPVTGIKPYNQTIEKANIALERGILKGILWHQGEGDSGQNGYLSYEKKFDSLLMNISKDLNIDVNSIPILVGELGPFFTSQAKHKEAYRIDSVLHQIANKHKNIYCVSSEGLTHKGDSTHFDTESLRILGQRYAKGYKLLKEKTNEYN